MCGSRCTAMAPCWRHCRNEMVATKGTGMKRFDGGARRVCFGLMVSVIGLGLVQPASAQTVEQFYKGKSITMLVGTAPGGINDISARFVGRWFGRFIPGNP